MTHKPVREGINWDDGINVADDEGTNEIRFVVSQDPDIVILGEPLYRTFDGRLTHQQDPAGRQLYGKKGDRVPREELEAGGLELPEEPGSAKVAKPHPSKARKSAKAKHAKKTEDK